MAHSLARAAGLANHSGQPLPRATGFDDLYTGGHEIYQGSLTMIAGIPGARKTAFALALVEGMGVPVLYFSADSDAATISSRLISMYERRSASWEIRKEINQDDYAKMHYAEVAAEMNSQIEFCFDSDPDLADVHDEIDAYVERYDRYPQVIVIDNLLDIFSGAEDDTKGDKATLKALKSLARQTDAAVIVLHHMREVDGTRQDPVDSGKPAPRSRLQNRLSQTPASVLSVASEPNLFHVAWIKDRFMEDDDSGKTYATFRMDADHNVFEPYRSLAGTVMPGTTWSPSSALEE